MSAHPGRSEGRHRWLPRTAGHAAVHTGTVRAHPPSNLLAGRTKQGGGKEVEKTAQSENKRDLVGGFVSNENRQRVR